MRVVEAGDRLHVLDLTTADAKALLDGDFRLLKMSLWDLLEHAEPTALPESVSTDVAAKTLGVGERRIRTLVADGRLQARKVDGKLLVEVDSLHAYLQERNPTDL
jgi:excisionase family DNA binding protein